MSPEDKFYLDDAGGELAVLVPFINEPNDEDQNMRVTAKARIVFYDDSGKELCRVNDGCWLDERLNTKEFDFDESHELMLCTMLEGRLLAFKNVRSHDIHFAEHDEGADCA